jgi:hypothetical protein
MWLLQRLELGSDLILSYTARKIGATNASEEKERDWSEEKNGGETERGKEVSAEAHKEN